jgi:hypothetical protein
MLAGTQKHCHHCHEKLEAIPEGTMEVGSWENLSIYLSIYLSINDSFSSLSHL